MIERQHLTKITAILIVFSGIALVSEISPRVISLYKHHLTNTNTLIETIANSDNQQSAIKHHAKKTPYFKNHSANPTSDHEIHHDHNQARVDHEKKPALSIIQTHQTKPDRINSITARFREKALAREEIRLVIPSLGELRAKKVNQKSYDNKTLNAFALTDRRGSITVISSSNGIEDITLFDADASRVFKGVALSSKTVELTEININSFICHQYKNADKLHSTSALQAAEIQDDYFPDGTTPDFAEVASLESKPSSAKIIYIDYWGGVVTGTAWNDSYTGGAPINYLPYSLDSNTSSFTSQELHYMYAAWAEMAEDYAPFNVNITTDVNVYNSTPKTQRSRIIATSSSAWVGGGGGIAFVDVYGKTFNNHDGDYLTTGWSFNKNLSTMGMTHSHESGHQMGLVHDGNTLVEYDPGHGNWGSIMGGAFGKDYVQWSNGTYPNARHYEQVDIVNEVPVYDAVANTQDDFAIITNKLGVITDDAGNTNASAETLVGGNHIGVITPKGSGNTLDKDVYKFSVGVNSTINITTRSLFEDDFPQDGGLNLSAKVSLRNTTGTLIAEKLPSETSTANNFEFSSTLASGTYYLTVEPQSYDSNASTGFNEYGNGGYYQIISNLLADLSISNLASNTATVPTNTNFSLSSLVNNLGTGLSGEVTYQIYRSADSSISTADTLISTQTLAPLESGISRNQSNNLTSPLSVGTYYYGVCVSAENTESNTANNCSNSIQISVINGPDLIVETSTASPTNVIANTSFTFNANVKNIGDFNANSSSLRYYLSSDNVISTADTPIGTDSVSALTVGSTSAESININAPTTPNTYFYGACVDNIINETNTTNNCSSAVTITVVSPPDLIIQSFSTGTTTITQGTNLSLASVVTNTGGANSSSTTLRYYRSNDAVITSTDTAVATNTVGLLAPSGIENDSAITTAPTSLGTYYYGVCVGIVTNETIINNNCSAGVAVAVVAQTFPDLALNAETASVTKTSTGEPFSFGVNITNQGSATAAATTIHYYLSLDNVINSSDTLLDSNNITTLGVNSSSIQSTNLSVPNVPGTYYFGACVVADPTEQDTANNCSNSVLIMVLQGYAPDQYEDDDLSSNANLITNQESQSHNIHTLGDTDWLTFDVEKDATNLVLSITSSFAAQLEFELYDASLNSLSLFSDANANQINLAELQQGNYYIRISENSNMNTVSDYQITLNYTEPDDGLCFPVKAKNNKVAVICL